MGVSVEVPPVARGGHSAVRSDGLRQDEHRSRGDRGDEVVLPVHRVAVALLEVLQRDGEQHPQRLRSGARRGAVRGVFDQLEVLAGKRKVNESAKDGGFNERIVTDAADRADGVDQVGQGARA